MHLILSLLSGIALLAYSISVVKNGVLKAFGSNLNTYVARSLKGKSWPLRAVLAGLFTTALVQSSNATAMLVASFLSSGLISLTPALTIMLGADAGSAVMARLLTYDLSALSPILIIIGAVLFLRRHKRSSNWGQVILGLGLTLSALALITGTMAPLKSSALLKSILLQFNGDPALALLGGALLAMLCYSSLAAVLLTALLSGSQSLTVITALTMVIGANLGSCMLEILGTAGHGLAARRVMVGNTLFKLSLSVIALPLILLLPLEQIPLHPQDQVIWFHVIFNLTLCLSMLPLTALYAKALMQLLPDAPGVKQVSTPQYLDKGSLDNPALSLSNAVRETIRLGGLLHTMMAVFKDSVTGKTELKPVLQQQQNEIESLSASIRAYLDQIDFDDANLNARWHQIFTAAVSAVHAGDLIKRMQAEVEILNKHPEDNLSAHSRSDLIRLIKIVNENLALALNALMTGKEEEIENIFSRKSNFKHITDKYSVRQIGRLPPETAHGNDIGALVLLLISDLRQLNGIFCSLASSRWAYLSAKKQMRRKHPERTLIDAND